MFFARFAPLFTIAAVVLVPTAYAGDSVRIDGVPHVRQKPDFCGEACVEMVLRASGSPLTQDDVFAAGGIDPALGRGLYTRGLKRAVERLGYDPGRVWHHAKSEAGVQAQWARVHADLKRGVPSIVCMHYDASPDTTEHFRLVLGYDDEDDEVVFHDPAVEGGAYQRMKRRLFLRLWPLKYEADRWTVIRLPLVKKGSATYVQSRERHRPADYAQHVLALRESEDFPRGFTVVIEPPFVVLGDEEPIRVRRRAAGTVRWAVDKLKQDYFDADPEQIIDVWLFANRKSYESNVRSIFGGPPGTPYGFYSPQHRALIMNIATGGGTLVHEIVHPFIEANFEDAPPWFNEGLGSLYEQSGERRGRIIGHTNWRLAGLQEAIKNDEVPSFAELSSYDEGAFYGDDTGVYYAASRYLLYYLQEKSLLIPFYDAFRRDRAKDPTGYRTLVRILAVDDMRAFERKWRRFVMRLSYP